MTNDTHHDALAAAGQQGRAAFMQELDRLVELEKAQLKPMTREQFAAGLLNFPRKKGAARLKECVTLGCRMMGARAAGYDIDN